MFTGTIDTDFTATLAGQDILIVPELENNNLGPAMSESAKAAIALYVSSGHLLIKHGFSTWDPIFLNAVFGFALTSGYSGTAAVTLAAAGTAFAGGPASLPWNDGTNGLTQTSLPVGGMAIYPDGGSAPVALIPEQVPERP